jgi:peptidylprolyl isomerase
VIFSALVKDSHAAKRLAAVATLLAAVLLAACGTEEQSTDLRAATSPGSTRAESPWEDASPAEAEMAELLVREFTSPDVDPTKFVVKDVRKGAGATLGPGDRIHVDYFIIDYEDLKKGEGGHLYESSEFAFEAVIRGWRKGLPGMKVGGRRVMIVPPRLGFGGITHAYVVDLLGVPDRRAS